MANPKLGIILLSEGTDRSFSDYCLRRKAIAGLDDSIGPNPQTPAKGMIGRSEGAEVQPIEGSRKAKVYTTCPDTLFGATYMWLPRNTPTQSIGRFGKKG